MGRGSSSRAYLAVIIVLLGIVAAMAYKFIVAGSTAKGEEDRVAVVLERGERALVLAEMRGFVAGLQAMAAALSRADMRAVAQAARAMGMARGHDAPIEMVAKLPLEFKTLALGVHRGFDAIAADAEAGGKPEHALAQLADVLGKCVACHARYEFPARTTNAAPAAHTNAAPAAHAKGASAAHTNAAAAAHTHAAMSAPRFIAAPRLIEAAMPSAGHPDRWRPRS